VKVIRTRVRHSSAKNNLSPTDILRWRSTLDVFANLSRIPQGSPPRRHPRPSARPSVGSPCLRSAYGSRAGETASTGPT
jgi:hypothetical protein